MKRFWYFIREAYTSIRTHQASTLIGIVTTAFTLTSFGIFLLLYHNVHNILGRVQHNIQIIVYPKNDIEPGKLQDLQQAIKTDPAVDSLTFISKQDALTEFKRQFPEEVYLLEGLGESPFPASLVVTMAAKTPTTDMISKLVNRLQHNPDIERVRYNRDWIERLTLLIAYMELGALVVGGILALASITIIANTVQLAFHTRQQEIEILRLIGATSLFISIPYLIEGAILGAAGGGMALGFLRGGFELFTHKTQGLNVFGGFSSVFEFFPLSLSLLLIAGGILLGCLGTLTTIYGSMRFRL
jgi:cell division transport system permease protein